MGFSIFPLDLLVLRLKQFIVPLLTWLSFATCCHGEEGLLPADPKILDIIFSGRETLHYSIAWTGGIKIGDLHLTVNHAESGDDFIIHARVTDYGLFKLFYPVDDTFTTHVRGPWKLPYRYEVEQREGWGNETRRLTRYDQQNLQVRYRKNDDPEQVFPLQGFVHNEYSSFFITRALVFNGDDIIVPTFADKKRHEVVVRMLGREKKKSMFGEVDTIRVMPKMNFRGLYDKDGDTVFWLTDDDCRIPVEIKSKILIGSLTATLQEYSNPRCEEDGRPLPSLPNN